jgi:hypothetical protein
MDLIPWIIQDNRCKSYAMILQEISVGNKMNSYVRNFFFFSYNSFKPARSFYDRGDYIPVQYRAQRGNHKIYITS